MNDLVAQVIGLCIAGAIMYAARELKGISNAVRDLDYRVSRLEHWLHGEGFQQRPKRPADDAGAIEKRSGSRSS